MVRVQVYQTKDPRVKTISNKAAENLPQLLLQKDQSIMNITMIPGDLVVKVCPRSDSVTYKQLNSIHKDSIH